MRYTVIYEFLSSFIEFVANATNNVVKSERDAD